MGMRHAALGIKARCIICVGCFKIKKGYIADLELGARCHAVLIQR